MSIQKLTVVLFVLLPPMSPQLVHAQESDEQLTFFEKSVRPLLVDRCYPCHSEEKTSGGLALDTRQGWQAGGETGPAIIVGNPQESLLINAINYQTHEMPPADAGGQLSTAEIELLTQWVQRGAYDPREHRNKLAGMPLETAQAWWSFQPLTEVTDEPTPETIDALIDAKLLEQSLTPNASADKRTLLRRAAFDLTGLPPTAADVQAFIADESPTAFSNVIEHLLESPQYGVRWGRHWLDVVRYADTAGENTDRPLPHAWRYRNWVVDAFNRDLSFSDFVQLQIAGDLLRADCDGDEYREGIIATGYLALARRFGHDIDKDVHLMYEDVIDNLGKTFLGLTVGCARCHDHKYDPVSAEDYYALYGIFDSTRFSFPGCEAQGQPRDLMPILSQAEVELTMAGWRERTAQWEAQKKRRDELLVPPAQLQSLANQSTRVLAEKRVGEGETVPLRTERDEPLPAVAIKRGEVLLLTISPNENHGADTTLVEWSIRDSQAGGQVWQLADVIDDFTSSNPRNLAGAAWCYLEINDSPQLLTRKLESVEGRPGLQSWSNQDLPNVFVNSNQQPETLWTTLAARSLFVHPAPQRPVAIAWVCPHDGQFTVAGTVTDAHSAQLDGVSYTLKHIASAEFGRCLLENGQILARPLPEPEPAPPIPLAYAVDEATAKNAHLHVRGDHEKLGPEIPRRWLTVLGGDALGNSTESGRRELAKLIAGHPLTARVIVNRIWQGHFGQGLVRSSNDFGARGERPTHPELLDWLAAHFVAGDGSIKSLHRLIMNTAAYQRSSARSESTLAGDHDNRLLSRFERRRLSAEELRDSLLSISGNLDLSPSEAHPFPPESTWTFTQHGPFNAVYDSNRRSAYLMTQRQRRHPYLALFDGADTNSSTAVRQTTTVPTQALYFMNDPFFHQQAAAWTTLLLRIPDPSERMDAAFEQLFQRKPTEAERNLAEGFMAAYSADETEQWSAYARVLLSSNEFLHVD